ncbi:MAG: hypothetical protein BGO77_03455 [Caedibacter sp. 37-49]|nr:MAG: hypothetical protein BGO77_03455 [Caedibacter sp. 37-49]
MKKFSLKNDVSFEELKTLKGLKKVDQSFLLFLRGQDPLTANAYQQARRAPESLTSEENSFLLIKIATFLEIYLAKLFDIEETVEKARENHTILGPIWRCKRQFILRQVALKKKERSSVNNIHSVLDVFQSDAPLLTQELTFSCDVLEWLENKVQNGEKLRLAADYTEWALYHPEGQKKHAKGILFKLPARWDFSRLVDTVETKKGISIEASKKRERKGFHHTDDGIRLEQALDQAHYCIKCHPQGKDSCSKGLFEKGTEVLQKNPLGNTLTGCPLEQKISEMNQLKAQGMNLAAFAMILVDNPLVAATGHRICNDCMKACIFQKQEPVDIPSIETQILEDILALPWGFEIYALLVRWNPLNLKKPLPEASTGRNTLVVGMGPAGFTVSHYFLRDGHTVIGIDGLKIEPLPASYKEPIYDIKAHFEDLDQRLIAGFGGVAEYGITVRWQKNYLLLIRILLERQENFRLFGGIRFGSQLNQVTSWSLGFHHIALCCGAGSPRWLPLKNGMAPGVRLAQDFLMALQLTGASRNTSLSSLTVRLPIVVIGGGLTAIDAATEALAYYPLQVQKFSDRYQMLVDKLGKDQVTQNWQEEDHEIAEEFLAHAHLFAQHPGNLRDLLESLGGATILYRKDLTEAPSYRLNHEEVFKALQEGVKFLPDIIPKEVLTDAYGHANGLKIDHNSHEQVIPAKTILIATGTTPNTQVVNEYPEIFDVADGYLKPLAEKSCLVSKDDMGRTISHFGDVNAHYAGSVVKAMASAKQGVPHITESLLKIQFNQVDTSVFIEKIKQLLTPNVMAVNHLTPTAHELIIHAPLVAQQFQPGQFFRLQSYDSYVPSLYNQPLMMESLAVRGAWVDKEQRLIQIVIFEAGASSLLSRYLKPGDPVVLMGPTGMATEIPHHEKVLLVGEGHGAVGLIEIGKAMQKAGNEVHYLIGYEDSKDVIYKERLEQTADFIYWTFNHRAEKWSRRPKDQLYQGTLIETLKKLAETKQVTGIDRFLIIASTKTMAAIEQMRPQLNVSLFKTKCEMIASVNAPMQCMMKGVCGQCLQRHTDPLTGQESMVLSCRTQDQPLQKVDYESLSGRLQQNSLQEKVNALWQRHSIGLSD